MAEEVEISNVGGENGVASEATLASLTRAIEKLAASTGRDPKKEAGKVQKAHNDAVKNGITVVTKNRDALEEKTKAVKKATDATNRYSKAMLGAIGGLLGSVAGSALNLGKALLDGGTSLTDFAQHLPLVGSYLSIFTEMIDQNIDSFRTLSQVGATFGDGLNDIRAISARAGIPLSEFTELVAQNSEKMRFFGGGVASGARAFATMSKELRQGPGRNFMNLGYTAQELNESLIEYAEFTGTQMGTQRRQTALSTQSAANYLEKIDQLARVTGKRRDQIREEMQQNQADQRVRAATAKMTKTQALEFNAALVQAGSASPKLKEALIDMADGVANDPFTAMLAAQSETFREKAGDLENMTALQRNNFFAAVAEEADRYAEGLGVSLQGVIAGGGIAGDMASLGAELSSFKAMTPEQQAEIEAAAALEAQRNEGLKLFHDTIRNITTSLMTLLTAPGMDENGNALPSIMERITTGLSSVGAALERFVSSPAFKEGIENLSNRITKFVSDLENFDLKTALFGGQEIDPNTGQTVNVEGLFGDLGGQISETISSILWSGSGVIVGAIAGLFALSVIKDALVGGVSKMFEGLFSGSAASNNGPTRGSRTAGSSMGANIGGALGGLTGGVIEGVGNGLAAVGAKAPLVIAGAGAIGAAIVAIGAGIAGATWLIGSTLPTLAEGLASFEDLDGNKLQSAGLGMGAVAVGMAAFGVGSAVAGLGALVGSITEGLASLFGAEDPMVKLQRFAEYDIDAARVENNAKAMSAFGLAMAAFGAGAGVSGIGQIVGSIADGLSSLFGGESPIEQLQSFGNAQINAEGVERNANAMASFAEALSRMAGANFSDVDIPSRLVSRLEELSEITGSGLTVTAQGMQAIANVQGLQTNLDILNNGLDIDRVRNYNEVMESLVETLEQLNDVLAEDNRGAFGGGTGVAAADVLGQINTASTGSSEGINQLNRLMSQMLAVMQEMAEDADNIERNTRSMGSNIANGRISAVR